MSLIVEGMASLEEDNHGTISMTEGELSGVLDLGQCLTRLGITSTRPGTITSIKLRTTSLT